MLPLEREQLTNQLDTLLQDPAQAPVVEWFLREATWEDFWQATGAVYDVAFWNHKRKELDGKRETITRNQ